MVKEMSKYEEDYIKEFKKLNENLENINIAILGINWKWWIKLMIIKNMIHMIKK